MRSKLQEFLKEDIGSGDITSSLVVSAKARARARIVCKERCILAGVSEAAAVFEELGARVVKQEDDGSTIDKGDVVLEVEGLARDILAGERLALNFVMRMSGIATITHALVAKCRRINPKVRIAATRKTTPGFREFEKKAVVIGGGDPHRAGLFDAILIKDNHIKIAGSVAEALRRAKRGSFTKKIEIEVENVSDARTAAKNGADIVMLDNFRPEAVRKLSAELKRLSPDVLIEASGGIGPENIQQYAAGADIISLGALTHSVKAIDFSMEMERA